MTRADSIQFARIEISDPVFERDGLRHVTVSSAALNRRGDVTFYVPPNVSGYRSVPLILLLHGVYGSHWAWTMKAGAHHIAADMIASGQLPPCVLAMPSDGLWGQGSGYVPHREHDPERWIVDEVPAMAAIACSAVDDRSPLCIAGLSMGGFGALRLAGKYPARFAAAAAHSAITHVDQHDRFIPDDRSGWSMAGHDGDILTALILAESALPPIRIDCGRDDPQISDVRALHAALTKASIRHEYAEHSGGHDWAYWQRQLPAILKFFTRVLQQ
jgi:putative tributyrin esterase